MSLFIPPVPSWGFNYNSDDVRPAAAMGTTVTPGNNSMGSWAEIVDGALITSDVFGIEVNFNSNAVSAAARNTLCDIGVDPTAGTSYSTIIPYLLATSAAPRNVGQGGIWYFFPLFIPAGSSIACRASVDNATVGTLRVAIRLYGRPRFPDAVRVGRRVEAVGTVTGTSEGTVVAAGGASEGSWTSLGTISRGAWFFQLGVGSSDASLTAGTCDWDLAAGDATNKRIIGQPLATSMVTGTAEQFSLQNRYVDGYMRVDAGETIYARGRHSGTPDTDVTVIAYALGG